MARVEAQKKLGFYPALAEVVWGVKARLSPPSVGDLNFNVLDPCCGEGAALSDLVRGWRGARAYGIELDSIRAEKARQMIPTVLNFPYEDVRIGSNEKKVEGVSALWCNPPYEFEMGGGQRQETTFLENLSKTLVPGGVLVFLIPLSAILNTLYFLSSRFHSLRVYKGDDKWKQVVVLGRYGLINWMGESDNQKLLRSAFNDFQRLPDIRQPEPDAACPDGCGNGLVLAWDGFRCADCDGVVEQSVRYEIPSTSTPLDLRPARLNMNQVETAFLQTDVLSTLEAGGCCKSPKYLKQITIPVPLTPGLTAIFLQNGLFDGQVYENHHPRCHVVHGSSRKRSVTRVETDDRGNKMYVTSQIPQTVITVAEFESGLVYELGDAEPEPEPEAEEVADEQCV